MPRRRAPHMPVAQLGDVTPTAAAAPGNKIGIPVIEVDGDSIMRIRKASTML